MNIILYYNNSKYSNKFTHVHTCYYQNSSDIYYLYHTILSAIFMLSWKCTQICSNKSIYNIDPKVK